MTEDWSQLNIPKRRPRPEESTRKLGQLVDQFLAPALERRQQQTDPVIETWEAIVPPGLKQQCRLKTFDRGQLTVAVRSPAFMYEFQLCSQALLKEMQDRCPRAGIKRIRTVLG